MFFQLFLAILWIILYTAAPAAGHRFGAGFTALALAGGFAVYGTAGRLVFRHMVRRASDLSVTARGAFLERALSTHGVLVLGLFSFYFFFTDARSLLEMLFAPFPTLAAFVFFLFFMAHLNAAIAADAYAEPGGGGRAGLFSGSPSLFPMTWLAFLPWLVLSGISDILSLVTYGPFARAWQSPAGQAFYLISTFLMVALLGPALVVRFWGSRPLPEGPLRSYLEGLCRSMRLSYAGILTWPMLAHMPTAAVMGAWGRFRYILVTDALFSIATPEELAAVLAHETGHVMRRHVWYYLAAVGGFALLAFGVETLSGWAALSFFGRHPLLFLSVPPDLVTGGFRALVQVGFFVLFFRFFFGYFMRNFEREADLFVFETEADPRDLVSCLKKIALFSGKPIEAKSWHHFGIGERVDYVERAIEDPGLITRHAAKVKASLAAGAVALVLLGAASLALATGSWGNGVGERLALGVFEALEKTPDDPARPGSVDFGDYLYGGKKYGRARAEYEKVLARDPENARAANNLAWMLATCPDKENCDPALSLTLARKAVLEDPEPHVLDTLAEALFRNGRAAEALGVEREARIKAEGDRRYFDEQIERFKAAMK